MFTLINIIIYIVLMVLAKVGGSVLGMVFGLLYLVYGLGVLLPSIGVTVRRLHDTNRSGWWFLLAFVPVVNIVLLVFLVLESTPGDNQYGPSPIRGA
jgi:uncharacterized membrane protein YhaH (DUF805 family)